MNHPDPHKITREQLEECGCDICQSTLLLMDKLDQLIESADRRDQALTQLDESLARLETTIRRGA